MKEMNAKQRLKSSRNKLGKKLLGKKLRKETSLKKLKTRKLHPSKESYPCASSLSDEIVIQQSVLSIFLGSFDCSDPVLHHLVHPSSIYCILMTIVQ
jgi:hypothetical protein